MGNETNVVPSSGVQELPAKERRPIKKIVPQKTPYLLFLKWRGGKAQCVNRSSRGSNHIGGEGVGKHFTCSLY